MDIRSGLFEKEKKTYSFSNMLKGFRRHMVIKLLYIFTKLKFKQIQAATVRFVTLIIQHSFSQVFCTPEIVI